MTQSYCILGNPNVGKTSLFNALTGSYEYIGNWSGVTVEKKVGKLKDNVGDLVDLPGIYDLSPISKDETVVTDYLMSTSFTGMINIIDACQPVSYTHLRAHETEADLVCRLLLEKKKKKR